MVYVGEHERRKDPIAVFTNRNKDIIDKYIYS